MLRGGSTNQDTEGEPAMHDTTLIDAPECPHWCTEHNEPSGWTVTGRDVYKICRHLVAGAPDVDGTPVEFEIQRYAAIEDARLIVGEPTVRVLAWSALTASAALLAAATLRQLAELAAASGVIAA